MFPYFSLEGAPYNVLECKLCIPDYMQYNLSLSSHRRCGKHIENEFWNHTWTCTYISPTIMLITLFAGYNGYFIVANVNYNHGLLGIAQRNQDLRFKKTVSVSEKTTPLFTLRDYIHMQLLSYRPYLIKVDCNIG